MFNRLSTLVKLANERFTDDETIINDVYEKARKIVIRAAVKELIYEMNDVPNMEVRNGKPIIHR